MIKKALMAAAAITVMCLAGWVDVLAKDEATIDKSQLANGVVGIKYSGDFGKEIKVQVLFDSNRKENYSIRDNNTVWFPLVYGPGEYTVTVMRNVSGNKYMPLQSDKFRVGEIDDKVLFLNSIQNINYNSGMDAIKGTNGLLGGASGQKEKLDMLYVYIINHIKYDNEMANAIRAGQVTSYIPVIDKTYNSNKGICYDYSSLFAAVLRNNGIPTKLQKGFAADVGEYHAWNEVLIDGKWLKIDTTFDAALNDSSISGAIYKDNSRYTVQSVY